MDKLMESGFPKNVESSCPQLLDLIPQEREWHHVKREDGSSAEKKLELRLGLGPPGEDNWSNESLLSLGYLPSSMKSNGKQTHKFPCPEDHPVGSVVSTAWSKTPHHQQHQTKTSSFLQFPSTTASPHSLPVMAKESSQPCFHNTAVDLQDAERKHLNLLQRQLCLSILLRKELLLDQLWLASNSFHKNLASNSCSKLASDHQVWTLPTRWLMKNQQLNLMAKPFL
ncbi:Detected protein of unknown function [Hibiscus syriacus]|uniref:Uncharacterized protein n=1 Tax=Hibiscus syriacus TaxID=106335 RepID=A0A6A3AP46_HIBSY|nr:Detected protein of unknown function [Hibiscus syriacus]